MLALALAGKVPARASAEAPVLRPDRGLVRPFHRHDFVSCGSRVRSVLLAIDFQVGRQFGLIEWARRIAVRARIARRTAAARCRPIPRFVRMRPANPAAVVAALAFSDAVNHRHGSRLTRPLNFSLAYRPPLLCLVAVFGFPGPRNR
jgi:hypothetical protein